MYPRILIIAEHASARFGGEAILPLHYFRVLRRRGIDVRIMVNARTRAELERLFPDDCDRIHFIPDTPLHQWLDRAGRRLPGQFRYFTTGFLGRVHSQLLARRAARQLIKTRGIQIIHQPTPVSPRESSLLYDLGVPVVMGPMNGAMAFPPAFARRQSRRIAAAFQAGRALSDAMNRLMPGKLRASALLVANERTRAALPAGIRGRVITLVENGVDLAMWRPHAVPRSPDDSVPVRFVFAGRLVDWKAVDLLLSAFARTVPHLPVALDIIGDGSERQSLEDQSVRLKIADRVQFHGWKTQEEVARLLNCAHVFVLPSLYECGGAVVLEAMAAGLPVVATRWGGPADYIDESCGILVDPTSREAFVGGLADAMLTLARDPDLRRNMSRAGRERIERLFDWERKIDRSLEIYKDVAGCDGAP